MLSRDSHILIVDDASVVRALVRRICEEAGFRNILEAENGVQAWDTLNEKAGAEDGAVELVLSDINMPEMDGIELLRKIKTDDKLADTPIIMITSEGENQIVLDAIMSGATDYIVKPVSEEILIEKLKRITT